LRPTRPENRTLLQLEALEDRYVLSPTTLVQYALPGAGAQWNYSGAAQNSSPIFADLNKGYPDDDGLDEVLVPAADMQLYAYRYDPNNATTPVRLFQHYALPAGAGQIEATPVVVDLPSGRAVFAATINGLVFSWNARTGALLPGWPQSVGTPDLPSNLFILGAIAAGDLDGDGVPEIVVTSLNETVTAFHADGTVMWRYSNDDSIFGGVAIGDLNGDGRLEVVLGGDSSNVTPYYWSGGRITALSADGRREWMVRTNQVIWSSPTLVDLQGTGKLDVVVGTGFFYPQPPNGSFVGNKVYALDPNGNTLWTYATSTNAAVDGRVYSSPAVADLNGDGVLDVVVGDGSGRLHAINGANGTALWVTQAFLAHPLYSSAIIADINNSGTPDVVMADGYGYLRGFDGRTGNMIWDNPDAQAHYNAAAVGHFTSATNWELAVLPVLTNPAAGVVLSPSYLFLYELGSSTLTPPWAQFRHDSANDAVARPDGYSTQLVTDLYQGALGRAPSATELSQIWLPYFRHQPSLRQGIFLILSSQEARTRLINSWYQYYLGRPADAGSVNAILGAMNGGMSYATVQANLMASPEAFSKAGGNNQAWVTYLYQKALRRTPSSAEIGPWVGFLNSHPRLQVATAIFRSREYTQLLIGGWYFTYGGVTTQPVDSLQALGMDLRRGKTEENGLSDLLMSAGDYVQTQQEGSWLRAVYVDVLGRAATPQETAAWLQSIEQNGTTLAAIAGVLVRTQEYRNRLVAIWFSAYLGRAPSQAETAGYVNALNAGASWATVIGNIMSGDEFLNRAGGTLTGFIGQVVQDLQGHGADQATYNYWLTASQTQNIRLTMPAFILGGGYAGEYFKYTITGWFYQYLRRFPNTPSDQSRIISQLNPFLAQNLVDFWSAGGKPEDIQTTILTSQEYLQIALDKAFWTGQRWLA
jgi:hypothetical protein